MGDDIPPFLDRRPFVGSYTILNNYKTCPHRMYRQYIAKDLGPFVETPEMKWGDDVHKAFELRLQGGKPLPQNMQQWEHFAVPLVGAGDLLVEQKFGITAEGKTCDFFAKDVWFRGKVDVVLSSANKAYLPDFKTGSSKYENDFELRTNAMLVQAKYPHLTVLKGAYVWLKEDRMGEQFDLSNTLGTWKEVQALMSDILTRKKTGDWPKEKGPLCGWCSVLDCEHHRKRT